MAGLYDLARSGETLPPSLQNVRLSQIVRRVETPTYTGNIVQAWLSTTETLVNLWRENGRPQGAQPQFDQWQQQYPLEQNTIPNPRARPDQGQRGPPTGTVNLADVTTAVYRPPAADASLQPPSSNRSSSGGLEPIHNHRPTAEQGRPQQNSTRMPQAQHNPDLSRAESANASSVLYSDHAREYREIRPPETPYPNRQGPREAILPGGRLEDDRTPGEHILEDFENDPEEGVFDMAESWMRDGR